MAACLLPFAHVGNFAQLRREPGIMLAMSCHFPNVRANTGETSRIAFRPSSHTLEQP